LENVLEFLRSLWVVWLTLLFLGIVVWVYWPKRKGEMERHGEIPLRDDD
jgi:cytochrome c oxidase cbb3-type subunit 4